MSAGDAVSAGESRTPAGDGARATAPGTATVRPLSVAEIERLAEAAHDVFCAAMRERGHVYGVTTDETRRTHSALRPFAELTEDEREQNRLLARAIPDKLHAAGFMLTPAGGERESAPFSRELFERLAEDEHARWVRAKLAGGWRFAPETDKRHKLHASMIRWRLAGIPSTGGTYSAEELALMGPGELSEDERDKDRAMIAGIPQMLARAGLAVQPLPGTDSPGERAGQSTLPTGDA